MSEELGKGQRYAGSGTNLGLLFPERQRKSSAKPKS